MHIAVLGAGALGSIFAAKFASAGHRVTLLGRSPQHVEAICTGGLRVDMPGGNQHLTHGIDARTDATTCTPADLAICLTKSQDSASAAVRAGPLIGQATVVLSLQNGLGNPEALAGVVPGRAMIRGVTSVGASLLSPGHIEISPATADGTAPTWMGPWQDTVSFERTKHIANVFCAAGLSATAYRDIAPLYWQKLAMACAMNPVAALSGSTVREVMENQHGRDLVFGIIDEVIMLARAEGTVLDGPALRSMAEDVYRGTGDHVPSMAVDFRAGRPTEIGALNEAVAERAGARGLVAPICATVARLIRIAERNRDDVRPPHYQG